jgi:hypothetical protein
MNHAFYTARILVISLVLPLIFAAVALVVGFSLASHLPAKVPVHWDLAGEPNSVGSPYTLPITVAVVCLPLIAIFGGTVILWSHRGPLTPLIKLLAVTNSWHTILVSSIAVISLIDTTHENLSAMLGVGLGSATIVAAGLWFALPPGVRGVVGTTRTQKSPIQLASGERASWLRTTSASRAMIVTFAGVYVVVAVVVAIAVISSGGTNWWLSFIPLGVIVVVLSSFAWTVRVDARGVRVRGVLGIPVVRVPLDLVTSADVIDVRALAQYGGFGIRWALNGRIGVIVRSGEALEVHRSKGLDLVVTVDDAATAAALINGLVQQKAGIV